MARNLQTTSGTTHVSILKKLAPHTFLFFHSCGGIYDIIPDLIEAGVDVLNPVQVAATNMAANN